MINITNITYLNFSINCMKEYPGIFFCAQYKSREDLGPVKEYYK